MNDYLDMIKNPNRKASTSPAPDPSNTSRSSAPFPNPVSLSSENPHYVNNLDRIKSIDLKTWGTKEETPSSRGLRSGYESSFDKIGRDPTPRLNRFSAPITSIGERATTPTQSLFGDIPAPQPQNLLGGYKSSFVDLSSGGMDKYRDRSPRPMGLGTTLDASPSGGMFGNSSGSSASNRTSSKIGSGSITSNTGLFGESAYKGSGQDSITQRKSMMSMMSTQPSSTFSNTFRFGDVSRFGRDTSPLFDSQEKSPMLKKKQKKKVDAAIYILQALVVILVVVAVKVVFMMEHVVFCDNPDIGRPRIPGCVPCPEYGTCNYGRLVRCDDKYKEYKDECVLDYETTAKFAQYRSYINDRLAYYKGEKLCNSTIKDYLTLEEIRNELLAKYGNKDSARLNYNFEIQWEDYFETEEGLVKEKEIRNGIPVDIYTTADEGSPSLSCKCKLIWREGKLVGIWLVLFVATTVLTVKLVRLHMIYSRLGKEMYEDVREYLSHFKNVSVKTLKKEFEHKHPGKNFEKIWSYVENYRKEDARIYHYFDIFQGVNQEFWLRVR